MAKLSINEQDLLVTAVSNYLRDRRETLNMSQYDLAKRSGLHRSYIGDFERGARNISVKSLSRLAVALDLPISKVLRMAEKLVADETNKALKKKTAKRI